MKQWFVEQMKKPGVSSGIKECWNHYKRMLECINFIYMKDEKTLHPAWSQGARTVIDILEGGLIPIQKGSDWKLVLCKILESEYEGRIDDIEGAPWTCYGVTPDEKEEIIKELKERKRKREIGSDPNSVE